MVTSTMVTSSMVTTFTIQCWKFDNTVMGLKNHAAGSFTSSLAHRCSSVEGAKKPVIFFLVDISDPETQNPISCPVYPISQCY